MRTNATSCRGHGGQEGLGEHSTKQLGQPLTAPAPPNSLATTMHLCWCQLPLAGFHHNRAPPGTNKAFPSAEHHRWPRTGYRWAHCSPRTGRCAQGRKRRSRQRQRQLPTPPCRSTENSLPLQKTDQNRACPRGRAQPGVPSQQATSNGIRTLHCTCGRAADCERERGRANTRGRLLHPNNPGHCPR